jgi:hypothetical protein
MPIANDDFFNIILGSLPDSYDITMNAVTTAAEAAGKPLTPLMLTTMIKGKYDHHKSRKDKIGNSSTSQALASISRKLTGNASTSAN